MPSIDAAAPLVEVSGLDVAYPNGFCALHRIDLSMTAGCSLGLVGASGSGKSTLVKALLGLLPAGSRVSGRVRVAGVDMLAGDRADIRAARGLLVGYVAQDPFAACDPLHSVGHHVEAAWRVHRRTPPPGAAGEELAAVGIADGPARVKERPWAFSGGMLQRASIAAGTVHHPRLVLADEPTSALDADLAGGVLGLIDARSRGLLLVTHDLALVRGHCARVVVMDAGRIVEDGPTVELLSRPRAEATRRLVAACPQLSGAVRTPRPAGRVTIRATGLTHGYGAPLFAGLDLEVRAGQILGVQGPSGCGKSTLLRLLSGLEKPSGGEVRFVTGDGVEHAERPAGFAMPVFQNPVGSLSPRWPVWRSLAEPLRARGERRTGPAWQAWAHERLAEVGLADLDPLRRPGELSVGQAQRVAVARALAPEPAVVVADEPGASLDVLSAERVYGLLGAAADAGAAVVVVSHDTARLTAVADRLLVHRDGRFTPT